MITPEQFNLDILNLCTSKMGVLEAILYYCDTHELEFETVSLLIGSELKHRLRLEAENLNFLSKTSKLPI